MLKEIEVLEAQHRRRDLLVTDIELAEKFAKLLPAEVVDGKSFERWYRSASKKQPDLLCFSREDFLQQKQPDTELPTELDCGVVKVKLRYHFEVGSDDDGITAIIPLAVLNQLTRLPFEWLVPSMLEDKVVALIKALPKAVRKYLVPAPDFATAAVSKLEMIDRTTHSLMAELVPVFSRLSGQTIEANMLLESNLEHHHRMRFEVVDTANKQAVLATGRDLTELQQSLSGEASKAFVTLKKKVTATGAVEEVKGLVVGKQKSARHSENSKQQSNSALPEWSDTPLPLEMARQQDGMTVTVFPGLSWNKGVLKTELFETSAIRDIETRGALILAIQAKIPDKYHYIAKKLPDLQSLKLALIGLTEEQSFIDDLFHRLTDDVFLSNQCPTTVTELTSCVSKHKATLISAATDMIDKLSKSMTEWRKIRQRLNELHETQKASLWQQSIDDIESQLNKLIYSRFLRHIPITQLKEYQRYCKAIGLRLDKLQAGGYERDKQMMLNYQLLEQQIERRIAQYQQLNMSVPKSLWECRWLIQELRVSLFAQTLGTKQPVSKKRIESKWVEVKAQTYIAGIIE